MKLRTLPEQFLAGLVPPRLLQEDPRGLLAAVLSGFQDRLSDVRTAVDALAGLVDPRVMLPTPAQNVVQVKYYGQGPDGVQTAQFDVQQLRDSLMPVVDLEPGVAYVVLTGQVTYSGVDYLPGQVVYGKAGEPTAVQLTGTELYTRDPLYQLVNQELGIDLSMLKSVVLATDPRRQVQVNSAPYMADTLGAVLYTDDASQQRRSLESYFPRLKLKGTAESYQVLGYLVGFEAKFTPLWGCLSPRRPDDVGHVDNMADFGYDPVLLPTTPGYEPTDAADGDFYRWPPADRITPLSADPDAATYYLQLVNGANPFIKLSHDGVVTAVNLSGTTATVTTAKPHQLATGAKVWLRGADQASYNGQFNVTVTSTNTFTVDVFGSPAPATGALIWSAHPALSGPVTSMSVSGFVVTALTPVPHGLVDGDLIAVSGADQPGYNQANVAVRVLTPTAFQYRTPTPPATSATGDLQWTATKVTHKLSGGAPHTKASTALPGTGLVATALAEGAHANGLALEFTLAPSGQRYLTIYARLSSVKYRSSLFDLSLLLNTVAMRQRFPDVPVESNPDTELGGGAVAPYRPWAAGKSTPAVDVTTDPYLMPVTGYAPSVARQQLREVARQLDVQALNSAGLAAVPYFDELRTATRFQRKVAFGLGVDDTLRLCPDYAGIEPLLMTITSGLPVTITGTLPSWGGVKKPVTGDLVMVVAYQQVLTRGVPAQRFTGKLAHVPVYTSSLELWVGGVKISAAPQVRSTGGADDAESTQVGQLRPIPGKVLSGSIRYDTGDITLETDPAYTPLSLEVRYEHVEVFSAERDEVHPTTVYYGSSPDSLVVLSNSSIDFETFNYSITLESVDSAREGMVVGLRWRVETSEVVRDEPHPLDKVDLDVVDNVRPQDELNGTGNFDLHDDVAFSRPITAGGELVDLDVYRPGTGELVDLVTRELTLIDHRGVEYDATGHESDVTPFRLSFQERTHPLTQPHHGHEAVATKHYPLWDKLAAYVIGDRVEWQGVSYQAVADSVNSTPPSVDWKLTEPEVYHVGLCHGVLVADLSRFMSPAHLVGLAVWLPCHEHPRDNLSVYDAVSATAPGVTGAVATDRVWDSQHGWGLRLVPGAAVALNCANLAYATHVTWSCWLKLGSLPSSPLLTEETVVDLWPLVVKLSNTTNTLKAYWTKTDGTLALACTFSLSTTQYQFVALTFNAGQVSFVSNAATLAAAATFGSTSVAMPATFDQQPQLRLRAHARQFEVRDLRLWARVLSQAQLNTVRCPKLTPTLVPYLAPVCKTPTRALTLKVLDSGYVVADLAQPAPSVHVHAAATGLPLAGVVFKRRPNHGRVRRYTDDGSYVGQPRYQLTGSWGSKDVTSTVWNLGRHGYNMLGDGQLLVSPSWTPDWLGQFFASEGGVVSSLAAWSLGRDLLWLKGGTTPSTAHTYRAQVQQLGGGGVVLSPTLDDFAGEVTLVANGTHYLGVHEVSGAPVVYVEGAAARTTTPVYLYGNSTLVLLADTAEAYQRWDHKDPLVSAPQLTAEGVLRFTNSEPLAPGKYRLTVDAGNDGVPDQGFLGFRLELTVGTTTVPATFKVDRGLNEVEFELTSSVAAQWPLQLRWTNYADVTEQGFQRLLVVYGFRLELLQASLFRVTHNASTVTVEAATLVRTPGSLSPGAWLVGYSSAGNAVLFTHETEVRQGFHALSAVLTPVTEHKRDSVVFVADSVPTQVDPAPLTPIALGDVAVSGGPAYNAGDLVDVTVAVSAGSAVTYAWRLELASGEVIFDAVTDAPTLTGVKLSRGGDDQVVRVVAVDAAGNSDTAVSASFDVEPAPVFTSITVTVNDVPVPYQTGLSATTLNPADTILWYEGPGETNLIAALAAYTVAVARTVYVVATGPTGIKTTVAVALRSAINQPPVVTAYASKLALKVSATYQVKAGETLYLHGFATDQDLVGGLTYTWEFGTFTASGTMVLVSGTNYAAPQHSYVVNLAPGRYKAEFTVTDSLGASGTASFELQVVENLPPEIKQVTVTPSHGTLTAVPEGSRVAYTTVAADPENDPVTVAYRLTELATDLAGSSVVVDTSYQVTNTFTFAATAQSVTLSRSPVVPGSVEVFVSGQQPATDNGLGTVRPGQGVQGGSVNYLTGQLSLVLTEPVLVTVRFKAYYRTLTGFVVASDGQLEVNAALPAVRVLTGPVISSGLSAAGSLGKTFEYRIESTPVDGPAPTFAAGSLPPGLALVGSLISGVPTLTGTFTVPLTLSWPPFTDTRQLLVTITEFDARPPGPLNLMAFNDGVNPRFNGTEAAIDLRWSIADDPNDPQDLNLPLTILEFRTMSDQLVDTLEVPSGVDTYSYPLSRLLSSFGSAQTFVVHAYHARAGLRSTTFDKLTVRKV